MNTRIYIDAANLYWNSNRLGFKIDYQKFAIWLRQKYQTRKIYLFIGFIPSNMEVYDRLISYGYILIFKETVLSKNKEVKGNCDGELILKVCKDFYEKEMDRFVVITSDGDFACLVNFLCKRSMEVFILSPDKGRCSILLRKTNSKIIYLNDHYHKFSRYK